MGIGAGADRWMEPGAGGGDQGHPGPPMGGQGVPGSLGSFTFDLDIGWLELVRLRFSLLYDDGR